MVNKRLRLHHKIALQNLGLTLIELLIVITIIGIVSAIIGTSVRGSLIRSRDAQRKHDLEQIRIALQLYYQDHGDYPQAGPDCAYDSNCYVESTGYTFHPHSVSYPPPTYEQPTTGVTNIHDWIPDLVPGYSTSLPVDPINVEFPSWGSGAFTYQYGNVTTNHYDATGNFIPASYDLSTYLENPNDPQSCGVMHYEYGFGMVGFGPWFWCDPNADPSLGPGGLPQVYNIEPPH